MMTRKEQFKIVDEYKTIYGNLPCEVCGHFRNCPSPLEYMRTNYCHYFCITDDAFIFSRFAESLQSIQKYDTEEKDNRNEKIRKEWQKKRMLVRRRRALARSFARAFARELERASAKEIDKIFNNIHIKQ